MLCAFETYASDAREGVFHGFNGAATHQLCETISSLIRLSDLPEHARFLSVENMQGAGDGDKIYNDNGRCWFHRIPHC